MLRIGKYIAFLKQQFKNSSNTGSSHKAILTMLSQRSPIHVRRTTGAPPERRERLFHHKISTCLDIVQMNSHHSSQVIQSCLVNLGKGITGQSEIKLVDGTQISFCSNEDHIGIHWRAFSEGLISPRSNQVMKTGWKDETDRSSAMSRSTRTQKVRNPRSTLFSSS